MHGSVESTLNLKIAKKTEKILKDKGFHVIMTRRKEDGIHSCEGSVAQKKKDDMRKRLEIINSGKADIFVSIHMNKFSQESQRGAQVFFDREQEEGEALAQALEQRLFVLDPDYARQPSAGDYYILNACPASALVECGFLSNREEERLLAEESYQQRLAQAIACGVEDYFTNRIERRP